MRIRIYALKDGKKQRYEYECLNVIEGMKKHDDKVGSAPANCFVLPETKIIDFEIKAGLPETEPVEAKKPTKLKKSKKDKQWTSLND